MKKRGSPAPRTEVIDWPRSDPAELAKFDPETKVCTMNCGQIREDPRSHKEHKFQCGDCYVVAAKPPKIDMTPAEIAHFWDAKRDLSACVHYDALSVALRYPAAAAAYRAYLEAEEKMSEEVRKLAH